MGKAKNWINKYWQVSLTIFIGFIALLLLMVIHIKSINPGYSASELAVHNNLTSHIYSFHYLWHNLIDFPYTIVLVVIDKLHFYGLSSIRTTGALFGFLSAVLFFYITYQWYEKVAAVLGTILFVANFWFLENTRSGQLFSIYPLVLLGIIACVLMFNRNKKSKYNLLILSAALSLSIYVAGVLWFLALGIILRRKSIQSELMTITNRIKIEAGLISFVLLLPLLWYIYNSPLRLKGLLGIPIKFSPYKVYLKNFLKFPLHLFVINNDQTYLTIGRLPMFDIFGTVLFLLGLYWSFMQYKFKRTSLIFGGLLISWVLSSFGVIPGFVAYVFIMIFITSGILYLISKWYSVFPSNPYARAVGATILSATVLTLALYHINQYYIVWPHTPATLSAYSYIAK